MAVMHFAKVSSPLQQQMHVMTMCKCNVFSVHNVFFLFIYLLLLSSALVIYFGLGADLSTCFPPLDFLFQEFFLGL